MSNPIWFDHALKDFGEHEIPGPEANPRVLEALRHTTLPADMKKTDETANCSAYMCMWFEEVGMDSPHSAAARSWLKWGIPLESPVKGCVVILNRGGSPDPSVPGPGHVTLFDRSLSDNWIRCFGGNQSDQCKYFQYKSADVLGYRWPEGVELPA